MSLANKRKHILSETIEEYCRDFASEHIGGKVYEIICRDAEESNRRNNA